MHSNLCMQGNKGATNFNFNSSKNDEFLFNLYLNFTIPKINSFNAKISNQILSYGTSKTFTYGSRFSLFI
ncbi:hypothetical protein BpHYR1_025553 [Brachionus plicatilis]|uniref:Uncharacterized protein n=1 Tax=Brachionus plicatilis TaxID=10195 RepID=A0A3M7R0C1_BRAPC|nr:hypothetical protein BpHYR1_025553 [Brachionus plicatilis]